MAPVLRTYRLMSKVQMNIALLSDLHGRSLPGLYEAVAAEKPDVICLAGDMLEYMHPFDNEPALLLIERLARIAPTLYAPGNHDLCLPREARIRLKRGGVTMLRDACTMVGGVCFGGLCDGGYARRFAQRPGCRILLCHWPEYYPPLLAQTSIDLILSGHAHGGQWRIGNRGVYAPGQGLWPAYTGGLYENRLLVSRGLANTTRIPRFFNPREWAMVRLEKRI